MKDYCWNQVVDLLSRATKFSARMSEIDNERFTERRLELLIEVINPKSSLDVRRVVLL